MSVLHGLGVLRQITAAFLLLGCLSSTSLFGDPPSKGGAGNGECSRLKGCAPTDVHTAAVKDIPILVWWTKFAYPYADHFRETTCPESTCYSTSEPQWLCDRNTRGVIFYGTELDVRNLPLPRAERHEWALLHEESALNCWMLSHPVALSLFNHTSMRHRDSDFPLTLQSLPGLDYLLERKWTVSLAEKNRLIKEEGLAPVLYIQSHCDVPSDRDRYVTELMKYIDVDSYGECLKNKVLPDSLKDPLLSMDSEKFLQFISRYKFHLAFENALCPDYITEKLWRPLHVGSLPVYRGSPRAADYIPTPQSVMLVDDESPHRLAQRLTRVHMNDSHYLEALQYKEEVVDNWLLVQSLQTRGWASQQSSETDFIKAYECYLCDKITQRHTSESGDVPPRSLVDPTNLTCPQPLPSITTSDQEHLRSDAASGIELHIEDYWAGLDEAKAMRDMVMEGETNPNKWRDYLKRYSEHIKEYSFITT